MECNHTLPGLSFPYCIRPSLFLYHKNREKWAVDKGAFDKPQGNSKSLTWSSICLAYKKALHTDEVVARPKKLGDIRGISYIYPILWQFGIIKVPESSKKAMGSEMPGNTSFSSSYDNNKIIG